MRTTLAILATALLLGALASCTASNGPLPETAQFTVVRLSPDFARDGVIFLGTEQDGIFRSGDRGRSWVQTTEGIDRVTVIRHGTPVAGPIPPVYDIQFSPSFSQDGEVFFGSYGLFHSTDKGNSWRLLEDTPYDDVAQISVSPTYGQDRVLFIRARMERSFPDTYVWRSIDAGQSWKRLIDIGPEWEHDVQGLSYKDMPREVQFLPDGSIVGGSLLVTARSYDHGSHWQALYTSDVNAGGSIACSPDFDRDGVCFIGDNRGQSNISRLTVGQGEVLDLGFRAAFHIFYAGGGAYGGPENSVPVEVSPTFEIDGTAFASAYYEREREPLLLRSTDRGITWEPMALPSSDWVISMDISQSFATDHTVVVGTCDAVFLSTDAGDSWKQLGV